MRFKHPADTAYLVGRMDAETAKEAISERASFIVEEGGSADLDEMKRTNRQIVKIEEHLERLDHPLRGHPGFPVQPGDRVKADQTVLAKGESFADWIKAKGQVHREDEGAKLGLFLRGLATGDWSGAEHEQKLMSEGTLSAGGHLVPTPLAGNVIDLARNAMRVMQAGATTVPMTAQTLKIARQTGDPSGTWHTENTADISDSALTLDSVTLTARTLPVLVKLSVELLEDAPNVEQQIQDSMAAVLALELDRVALYGTGTAPQPRGLKNTSGIGSTVLGGANGSTPVDYDFVVDAIFGVRTDNHEPTGAIDAPRTEQTFGKLKTGLSGDKTPLKPPADVEALPRYSTNQVPVNLTEGTSVNCSDLFVGKWPELLVGMRHQVSIEFLRERYLPDTLSVAFLAYLRADIAVARPAAFEVVRGIRP